MDAFPAMLIPVVFGMLLLCIGFSYQERSSGVFMIWVGMFLIIGTIGFKIIEKLA